MGLGCERRIRRGTCRQTDPHASAAPPGFWSNVKADRDRAARGADTGVDEVPEAEHRVPCWRSCRPACDETPVACLVRPDASANAVDLDESVTAGCRDVAGLNLPNTAAIAECEAMQERRSCESEGASRFRIRSPQAVEPNAVAACRVDLADGGATVRQNSKPYRFRCVSRSGSSSASRLVRQGCATPARERNAPNSLRGALALQVLDGGARSPRSRSDKPESMGSSPDCST